jgi:transcriptional antiterminator NusG
MSEQWFAIRVEPGRERAVAEALRMDDEKQGGDRPDLKGYLAADGCELLLPIMGEKRKRRGVLVTVSRPALPGYLFRRMEMDGDAFHAVKDTPGVVGFLPARGQPMPINEVEIDMLLDAFEERFGESAEEQDLGWMLNKRFIIQEGPFTSFPGTCVGFSGRDVVMMVEVFGRLTPTTMPVTSIDLDPWTPARELEAQHLALRSKKAYTAGISKRHGRNSSKNMPIDRRSSERECEAIPAKARGSK